MASDEALEVSALRREASAEVTSSQSLEDFDYCESRGLTALRIQSPLPMTWNMRRLRLME
jgi:hypothetical protein